MHKCCLNITSWCCVVCASSSASFAAIKHAYEFSTVEKNPFQTHYIDPVRKETMCLLQYHWISAHAGL